MEPLIQSFTKNLKPCSGCGKTDLSDEFYDQFWSKKEINNGMDSEQANVSGSGDSRGGSSED